MRKLIHKKGRLSIGALWMIMALSAPAAETIPVVPLDVLKKAPPVLPAANKETDASKRQSKPAADTGQALKASDDASVVNSLNRSFLVVKEGRNVLIPVALGHINRLIVPFENPKVVTTSSANIQADGHVIYVATRTKVPVTMFITPEDAERPAISVSLIPKRIPPREIELRLDSPQATLLPASKAKAEKWERSMPYIEVIKEALKMLAQGRVPDGYSLSNLPENAASPFCHQDGLRFSFHPGQVANGSKLRIYIGTAQNITNRVVEFKERSCGNWGVAGVAAWPRVWLEPGQKTEVYVAIRNGVWVKRVPRMRQRKLLVDE